MSAPIVDQAAGVFADPKSYADEPRLHAALTHLRAHAPVSLVDSPPYRPFWAITKHADIMEIERANDLFVNEPRPLLATAEADDMAMTTNSNVAPHSPNSSRFCSTSSAISPH